jgi:carboxypeptidase family protein
MWYLHVVHSRLLFAFFLAFAGVSLACGSNATTSPQPTAAPTAASTPAATYTLSGQVIEHGTGRSIAGALARVADGQDTNKAAVADADGKYTLGDLRAPTFSLEVSAGGYDTWRQSVDVRTNPTLSIALDASIRTVFGTITDSFSRGVLPNILVGAADGLTQGASTHSDATGTYKLVVASNTTLLQFSAVSYLTKLVRIQSAGGDLRLDVVLDRTGGATPVPSPPAPTPNPAPPAGGAVITFDGAANANGFQQAGYTVATTLASWFVSDYGHPAPSIQFSSAAGVSTDGEVRITRGGSTFRFVSVDVYSSTTPIPWTFIGMANSATVYSIAGRQANTFGDFATVASTQSDTFIDTLIIRLTNPAAACCSNPMGIDNIVLR